MATNTNSNKIFVTQIDGSLDSESAKNKLFQLIDKEGLKIVDIQIRHSFNRQYSYAFIELEDAISAEKIIKKLNNYKLSGRRLRI